MESGGGGGGGREIGRSEESVGRSKYRQMVAQDNDRAVLEMSSIDLGSSSASHPPQDLKYYVISLLHYLIL